MIFYPTNWQEIGQPVAIQSIEAAIRMAVKRCGCYAVTLSGGIDSSLLLHYLASTGREVEAFTLGLSENHPDVVHARLMASRYSNVTHHVYIPTADEMQREAGKPGDLDGDENVRLLYRFIGEHVSEAIAGDGIDEWACGYWKHIQAPTETTYVEFLRRLVPEQLEPLHRNSGNIFIHLPYLDRDVIHLLAQVPLADKTTTTCRKRIMVELAHRAGIPTPIIERNKYGLCDALRVKGNKCTLSTI